MADVKFVRMRFTDADALRKAIDAYFDRVDKRAPEEVAVGRTSVMRTIPPTPAGLARTLGISTPTMYKYMRGEVQFPDSVASGEQEEILRIITEARMKIEEIISERALVGTIDNAIARQVLGAFGYNKCMDDSGEEANNKTLVIFQGASAEDIKNWTK